MRKQQLNWINLHGDEVELTDIDVLAWQKVEEVCAMLLDPPFQSCHELVSPLSYMASCSNDLCT